MTGTLPGTSKNRTSGTGVRTAILPGDACRHAHDAYHVAALLRNMAVERVHAEWREGCSPSRLEVQFFPKQLPRDERLPAHTTEMTAHDLHRDVPRGLPL